MKKICVITEDNFLFQKIKLDTPDDVTVSRLLTDDFSLCLFDLDTMGEKAPNGAVTMSRTAEADVRIPFPLGTVGSLLLKSHSSLLSVDGEARAAFLRGEKIKLTEVEFALLSLLASKGGEFVSREEILSSVWGGDADMGVINVYIHYLREKLERHGEKIIISSRKCGYKIEEKYLGGER
ncbi:MAG: winged helix-turn-helix transcriptional regulator [Ruminococcaceae bacterium]|nr:winged helix-turn-helix transcriptional regulator [Oscillospiraceae bacterium]